MYLAILSVFPSDSIIIMLATFLTTKFLFRVNFLVTVYECMGKTRVKDFILCILKNFCKLLDFSGCVLECEMFTLAI